MKTTVKTVISHVKDHCYRHVWKRRLQQLFHTLRITFAGTYENDGYNNYFKSWRSLLQANLKTMFTSHVKDHYCRLIWKRRLQQLFQMLKNTITGESENDFYNSYFTRYRSLLQARMKTTVTTVISHVKDHFCRHIWKRRLQLLFHTLKITVTGTSENGGYNS